MTDGARAAKKVKPLVVQTSDCEEIWNLSDSAPLSSVKVLLAVDFGFWCRFQIKLSVIIVVYYLKTQEETQSRINEIRLKVLEGNVAVLQQQVNEIRNQKQFKNK